MNRILLWIARLFGIGVVYLDQNLIARAEKIVRTVEDIEGVISGDYRRSIAMGKMLRFYPGVSKRDLAMAIEYVIRRGAI